MIKLKDLLSENVKNNISFKELSDMFLYAYVSIFDINKENIKVVSGGPTISDGFYHIGMSVEVEISYKLKNYVITHGFYYYKFPKEETENLSKVEWVNMMYYASKFLNQYVDKNSIKEHNPLFIFNADVYEGNKRVLFIDGVENLHSMKDVVVAVKSIIDNNETEFSNNDVPTPIPSNKLKLVGV